MSGSGSVEMAGPLNCSGSAADNGSSTTGAGAAAAGAASTGAACGVAAAAAAAAAALASRADMGAAAAGGAAAADDDCSAAAAAADDGAAASAFSEGLSAGSAAADVDTGVAASAAARRSRRLPAEVTAEATAICVEARWKALLEVLDGLEAATAPELTSPIVRDGRAGSLCGALTFTLQVLDVLSCCCCK